MTDYPECEKLSNAQPTIVEIIDFIDFIRNKEDITLCEYDISRNKYFMSSKNLLNLLYQYYDIDYDQLEIERRQILNESAHTLPDVILVSENGTIA